MLIRMVYILYNKYTMLRRLDSGLKNVTKCYARNRFGVEYPAYRDSPPDCHHIFIEGSKIEIAEHCSADWTRVAWNFFQLCLPSKTEQTGVQSTSLSGKRHQARPPSPLTPFRQRKRVQLRRRPRLNQLVKTHLSRPALLQVLLQALPPKKARRHQVKQAHWLLSRLQIKVLHLLLVWLLPYLLISSSSASTLTSFASTNKSTSSTPRLTSSLSSYLVVIS